MIEVELRKSDSRITTYTLWSETVLVETPVLCLGDVLSDPDGEALLLDSGTAPQTHAEPAPGPASTLSHPKARSRRGAPLPGLRAYAPADRGATKALKEEGKTQAEVAARVSTG